MKQLAITTAAAALALAAFSHEASAVVYEDNLVPSANRIGNA